MVKIPYVINDEQFEALISNMKNKNKLSCELMYYCGLRVSEVCHLRKEHIDLQKKRIYIEESKNLKNRYVPIHAKLLVKLRDYKEARMNRKSIYSSIKRIARKMKWNISPHSLRHCVSSDTEILTKNGWKNYRQIKEGEKIYSYNLINKTIEEDEIKVVQTYNYDRDLFNIKTRFIDCLATPEHKMVMKYSIEKTLAKKRKDIWNDYHLLSLEKLQNTKSLRQIKVLIGAYKKSGKSIGLEKAGILGLILSDGHISKRNKDVTIFQSWTANEEKCNMIADLLKRSGLKHYVRLQKEQKSNYSGRKHQMMIFRISKENSLWIFDFVNINRTPKNKILELNGEELNEIVKFMLLGDGTKNKYENFEYQGQNKERIDFFRIACLFTGRKTSMGKKKQRGKEYFRTYLTIKPECDILHRFKQEKYVGKVWCPSTNNNTFFAKRNGTIFLTGNSYATHLLEKGMSIIEVQYLLGHSNIQTTSIYLHTSLDKIQEHYENINKEK